MDPVLKRLLVVGAIVALLVAALSVVVWRAQRVVNPTPETVAAASLQGLREQNRLSAFAARFVAVVTSTQTRFGVLSARQTLIMPGLVRYEVDLARLEQRDVRWDARTKTLTVTLPPVEVTPAAIDLTQVQTYDAGGVLAALTDVKRTLDAANRREGQASLERQAREAVPMRLARDATRSAVERSFAMPLRAAGLDARVVVQFRGE